MGLACPSCDGPVGGPFRRGRRWRLVVHHRDWCAARTVPAARWWVQHTLISAAFTVPGADGDEVEVAHRVSARLQSLKGQRLSRYGGSESRVSPVWARNPSMSSGRHWMRFDPVDGGVADDGVPATPVDPGSCRTRADAQPRSAAWAMHTAAPGRAGDRAVQGRPWARSRRFAGLHRLRLCRRMLPADVKRG